MRYWIFGRFEFERNRQSDYYETLRSTRLVGNRDRCHVSLSGRQRWRFWETNVPGVGRLAHRDTDNENKCPRENRVVSRWHAWPPFLSTSIRTKSFDRPRSSVIKSPKRRTSYAVVGLLFCRNVSFHVSSPRRVLSRPSVSSQRSSFHVGVRQSTRAPKQHHERVALERRFRRVEIRATPFVADEDGHARAEPDRHQTHQDRFHVSSRCLRPSRRVRPVHRCRVHQPRTRVRPTNALQRVYIYLL